MKTYRIYCRYEDGVKHIGNVVAASLTHANTKAQQLFNRHAYAIPAQ